MNYLDQKGIIQNTEGKDASGSHARKWRLMFARHGFIYPQITRSDGFEQEELGRLDDLTPFGRVFLQADTFPAVQECFLRASSVEQYKMPDGNGYYSPLRWILAIMLELERRTGTSELSRIVNGGQTTYMLHIRAQALTVTTICIYPAKSSESLVTLKMKRVVSAFLLPKRQTLKKP